MRSFKRVSVLTDKTKHLGSRDGLKNSLKTYSNVQVHRVDNLWKPKRRTGSSLHEQETTEDCPN